MKKVLCNLSFTAILLGALLVSACKPSNNEQVQARIGVNVPLTGPIAGWSGQFANGFRMGIEDTLEEYDLPNESILLDIQDNAGQPPKAVSILQRHLINGIDAYVSVATGPANVNATELDRLNIPHFIAAFDPLITKDYPNRFRIMANSKIEVPLFLDYIKAASANSVHVLQINMAYAEEQWSELIFPELEEQGIQYSRDYFELADRDFRTLAEKAKVIDADLIFICGYSFHVKPAVSALRSAGLVQRGRVVSVMDFVDNVYGGTSLEELTDIVFVCPDFDIPGKVEGAAEWRQRYEQKYGMKPTYVPAYAYDNAKLLVKSLAKSGNLNTQSLLSSAPLHGLNGTVKLDQHRDIVATVSLAEVSEEGEIKEFSFD